MQAPLVLSLLVAAAAPAIAQEDTVAGGEALGPSPPPNRFDPEHEARLARIFGTTGFCTAMLPLRPAMRPREWSVPRDGSASRREALERHVLRDKRVAGEGGERIVLDGTSGLSAFPLAETAVHVAEDEVRFVRANGVHTVFVNGEGFVGDPERRGDLGVPVLLRAGENRIQLVGFDGGPLEVELWDPAPPLVIASWAVELLDGPQRFGDELFVPVFNATADAVTDLHFHYGRARTVEQSLFPGEFRCGGFLPPLGMFGRDAWLGMRDVEDFADPRLVAAVAVFSGDVADRRLLPTATARVARNGPSEPSWPPAPDPPRAHRSWTLVFESVASADVANATLAAARYCQQVVWYRTGTVPDLVSDAWFSAEMGEWKLMPGRQVVRFGLLADGESGVLSITREGEREYAIRASDAAAVRLVYLVDPFFAGLETPATFRVR